MTTKEFREYLSEAPTDDVWTVTLKDGGEVVCQANPKQNAMLVAYQQTTNSQTLERGDIIRPAEISDMHNQ